MDLQIFGGSGAGSGRKTGGGGTPSGVNYEEFMKMSEDERYDFMEKIINDSNIVVPNYLDKSITSKVMYGLGMNNKPTVVSDEELDKIKGADLYRLVYESPKSSLTSKEILEQIKFSDYTQLSDKGGSAYGKGLYFTDEYGNALDYSAWGASKDYPAANNPMMMRAKLKPGTSLPDIEKVWSDMAVDTSFYFRPSGGSERAWGGIINSHGLTNHEETTSLYALSHGIKGVKAKQPGPPGFETYEIAILDRSVLITSSANKSIKNAPESWTEAPNA